MSHCVSRVLEDAVSYVMSPAAHRHVSAAMNTVANAAAEGGSSGGGGSSATNVVGWGAGVGGRSAGQPSKVRPVKVMEAIR